LSRRRERTKKYGKVPDRELFVISIELMQRSVAIKVEGFQIARI
jgi:hypothetical protein